MLATVPTLKFSGMSDSSESENEGSPKRGIEARVARFQGLQEVLVVALRDIFANRLGQIPPKAGPDLRRGAAAGLPNFRQNRWQAMRESDLGDTMPADARGFKNADEEPVLVQKTETTGIEK